MERLAFDGVLVTGGPGSRWTCVKVPVFVPGLFGRRGRIPVLGTVNGHRFRAAIHSGGDGGFFVVIPRSACAAAGVGAGDRVAVTLERDDTVRGDPRPATAPN
jgi:hypothetical protein